MHAKTEPVPRNTLLLCAVYENPRSQNYFSFIQFLFFATGEPVQNIYFLITFAAPPAVTELDRACQYYNAVARSIGAHLVISSLMVAANDSAELHCGSTPSASSFTRISGACAARRVSALRIDMIPAGVPAGASRPYQVV